MSSRALRHLVDAQALVHRGAAQAGIGLRLGQAVALHQQGLGAVHHLALGGLAGQLRARRGQLALQRLFVFKAGDRHVDHRPHPLGRQARHHIGHHAHRHGFSHMGRVMFFGEQHDRPRRVARGPDHMLDGVARARFGVDDQHIGRQRGQSFRQLRISAQHTSNLVATLAQALHQITQAQRLGPAVFIRQVGHDGGHGDDSQAERGGVGHMAAGCKLCACAWPGQISAHSSNRRTAALRLFGEGCGKGLGGQASSLRGSRSALPTPLRCSALLARRITHYAGSARCVRTNAASQSTKRANARRHRPCAPRRAPFAPPPAPPSPFAEPAVASSILGMQTRPVERQAVSRGGRMGGAEARRVRGSVRSTPRQHARRTCSSAVSECERSELGGAPQSLSTAAESARSADRHPLSPPRLAAWRGRARRPLRGSISENGNDCNVPQAAAHRSNFSAGHKTQTA